jgi:hypothetical protein
VADEIVHPQFRCCRQDYQVDRHDWDGRARARSYRGWRRTNLGDELMVAR